MRILGIDYGDSRVGTAVSDPLGLTAQGIGTIKNKGMDNLVCELSKLIDKYNPEKIVIGLPKNMDGTIGFRGEESYKLKSRLEEIFAGEIVLWDERLSTVSAAGFLNETNTHGKNRKKIIDTVAAEIILENYMMSLKK